MNAPDSHEVSYLVIVRIISKFNTLLRMIYRLTIFTVTECSHWLVLAMLATSATHIKDGLTHNLFQRSQPVTELFVTWLYVPMEQCKCMLCCVHYVLLLACNANYILVSYPVSYSAMPLLSCACLRRWCLHLC